MKHTLLLTLYNIASPLLIPAFLANVLFILNTQVVICNAPPSLQFTNDNLRTRNENGHTKDYDDDAYDDNYDDNYDGDFLNPTKKYENHWLNKVFSYFWNPNKDYQIYMDEVINNREESFLPADDDERILYTVDDIQNWHSTIQDNYDKISAVYNITTNTVGDVQDTINTAPAAWNKHQWIVVLCMLAPAICLFGCVYRCIPCAPRIV